MYLKTTSWNVICMKEDEELWVKHVFHIQSSVFMAVTGLKQQQQQLTKRWRDICKCHLNLSTQFKWSTFLPRLPFCLIIFNTCGIPGGAADLMTLLKISQNRSFAENSPPFELLELIPSNRFIGMKIPMLFAKWKYVCESCEHCAGLPMRMKRRWIGGKCYYQWMCVLYYKYTICELNSCKSHVLFTNSGRISSVFLRSLRLSLPWIVTSLEDKLNTAAGLHLQQSKRHLLPFN